MRNVACAVFVALLAACTAQAAAFTEPAFTEPPTKEDDMPSKLIDPRAGHRLVMPAGGGLQAELVRQNYGKPELVTVMVESDPAVDFCIADIDWGIDTRREVTRVQFNRGFAMTLQTDAITVRISKPTDLAEYVFTGHVAKGKLDHPPPVALVGNDLPVAVAVNAESTPIKIPKFATAVKARLIVAGNAVKYAHGIRVYQFPNVLLEDIAVPANARTPLILLPPGATEIRVFNNNGNPGPLASITCEFELFTASPSAE